jgi:hypothetical protein
MSVNLLQSSPEQSSDDSDDESQQVSPATQTLDMLSSQLQFSQEDLMYDHSRRHVDSARVQQEQKEWKENQKKEQASIVLTHSPFKANARNDAMETKQLSWHSNKQARDVTSPSKSQKQVSPPMREYAVDKEEEKETVGSDDETVDPDQSQQLVIAPTKLSDNRRISPHSSHKSSKEPNESLVQLDYDESRLALGHHRSKRIAQKDPLTNNVIAIFPSISKAAEHVERDTTQWASYRSAVGRIAAAGKGACRKGFAWTFLDDDNNDSINQPANVPKARKLVQYIQQPTTSIQVKKLGKRVAQTDATGNIIRLYASFADAARAIENKTSKQNAYAVSIGRAASGTKSTCCKGLTWKLVDHENSETEKYKEAASADRLHEERSTTATQKERSASTAYKQPIATYTQRVSGTTKTKPAASVATKREKATEAKPSKSRVSKQSTVASALPSVSMTKKRTKASKTKRHLKATRMPPTSFILGKVASSDILSRNRRLIAQLDATGTLLRTFTNFSQAATALEADEGMRTRYRKEISLVVAGKKQQCRKGYFWKESDDDNINNSAVTATLKATTVATDRPKKKQKLALTEQKDKHVSFTLSEKQDQQHSLSSEMIADMPGHDAMAEFRTSESVDGSKEGKYSLNEVTIAMQGGLGMHLTQFESPSDLREAIDSDQLICCKANRINHTGIGAKSGFREGDVLIERAGEAPGGARSKKLTAKGA